MEHKMTEEIAIEMLDELEGDDPECDHNEADTILLMLLRHNNFDKVAEAYIRNRDRICFWYA